MGVENKEEKKGMNRIVCQWRCVNMKTIRKKKYKNKI